MPCTLCRGPGAFRIESSSSRPLLHLPCSRRQPSSIHCSTSRNSNERVDRYVSRSDPEIPDLLLFGPPISPSTYFHFHLFEHVCIREIARVIEIRFVWFSLSSERAGLTSRIRLELDLPSIKAGAWLGRAQTNPGSYLGMENLEVMVLNPVQSYSRHRRLAVCITTCWWAAEPPFAAPGPVKSIAVERERGTEERKFRTAVVDYLD
ncbi:hypothetical protein B0T17DRAFT_221111 [Bombardia bombarda]|uniref:Uncharacterized protein n=1 Tax=Bombardia bombarda TaxID=252184 RepID=A0AA39XBZ6_9PEZI|nr:hypothetical protein B0T17DRAFT_221111 [Bombardia bombarda]